MSSASSYNMRRVHVGSTILLICMSLPIADLLREDFGPEAAALGVFLFLFVAWSGLRLLTDVLWGREANEPAEPGPAARRQYLPQP